MRWYYKDKITVAQQRILGILDDGNLHALSVELDNQGHWNQGPAIGALVRKGLIEEVIKGGYYSQYRSKPRKV